MVAYVMVENTPMITIFEQMQFKRLFTGDPSDVELVLNVSELPWPFEFIALNMALNMT